MEQRPTDRVMWRDAWEQQGWTRIPHSLWVLKLSTGAKLTLMALMRYARQDDGCFPGQERLAGDVSASVRSVRNYIGELEDLGVIKVEHQGFGKPNYYWIEKWRLPS